MAQRFIREEYSDGRVVLSNIRNNIGIPIFGEDDTITATKVTEWYDSTPIDDTKADGKVYLKLTSTGEYFRVNLPNWGETFLNKPTMAAMRALSATEILLLKAGYYKGVTLSGYYDEGDTPAPIDYFLSDTVEVDDGGSVIEVGGVKLEHEFKEEVNLAYFGLQVGGDIFPYYYNATLKYNNIVVNGGDYTTSGGIVLKNSFVGINGIVNITSIGNAPSRIIKTPNIVITEVAQTHDLSVGQEVIELTNHGLEAGDFLMFRSNNRFTANWDGGTEIRPYYLDAELFKIKSVNGDVLTLDNKAIINIPVANSRTVQTWKATAKNVRIENIKVIHEPITTGNYSYGVDITGADNVYINNVYTQNCNVAGIQLDKSYNVEIGTINTVGGTQDLGLNYGLMVSNGTKFVNVNSIFAENHRHGLAGGGDATGGISMYVTVNNIFVRGSQSHSVDTHANCAYYTVKNANVDNFYSMSGVGHRMENITSSRVSYSAIALEGGENLYLGKAVVSNTVRFVQLNSIINSQIDYLELNYRDPIAGANVNYFDLPVGSYNIKIGAIVMNNLLFDPTLTADENSVNVETNPAVRLRGRYNIDFIQVSGFKYGVSVSLSDCVIKNMHLKNTGWSGSSAGYAITVQEGAHNTEIISGVIDNTEISSYANPSTRIIRLGGGTEAQITNNVSVQNIKYLGGPASTLFEVTSRFRGYTLISNKLGSGGSVITPSIDDYGICVANDFTPDSYPKASTLPVKATQTEVNTGTDDTKFVTPLTLEGKFTAKKASQIEVTTGTDNTKFVTPLTLDTKLKQGGLTAPDPAVTSAYQEVASATYDDQQIQGMMFQLESLTDNLNALRTQYLEVVAKLENVVIK